MRTLQDEFKSAELEIVHKRLPARRFYVLRLDGRAFHTFTRPLTKPFDERLTRAMERTAMAMLEEFEGARMVYTQSDEISIVVENSMKGILPDTVFGGKLQKLVSVAASVGTAHFNRNFEHPHGDLGIFDARLMAFDDVETVVRYLNWRLIDGKKNSVSSWALGMGHHRELLKLNTAQRKAFAVDRGLPWEEIPENLQRGFVGTKRRELKTTVFYHKGENEWKSQRAARRAFIGEAAPEEFTVNFFNLHDQLLDTPAE